MHGLPVKFSYFRHSEVVQLSNPNEYFFMDTSVGVVKKGLSRIGSHCLLMPVNSKMDDDTHLEVKGWGVGLDAAPLGYKWADSWRTT